MAYDLGVYRSIDLVSTVFVDGGTVPTSNLGYDAATLSITNPSATDDMLVLVEFAAPTLYLSDVGQYPGMLGLREVRFQLQSSDVQRSSEQSSFYGVSSSVYADPWFTLQEFSYMTTVAAADSVTASIYDTLAVTSDTGSPPLTVSVGSYAAPGPPVVNGWLIQATGWILAS